MLEQLTRHFRHVLIELKADEVIKPSLIEFLSNSSAGYFFVRACTEAAYRLDSVMHQLPAPAKDRLIRPIACLAPGEAIGDFDTLAQRLGAPIHMVVHGCPCLESPNNLRLATTPPCSFSGDLRRLARAMAGRTVGLALSSGAAKGFAHIGVIQVLEENGIEIDAVVGASMGAYVGSIWSYGYPGPELERLARELEGRWGLWSLIDPVFPPRQGFLRGVALKRRLMRSIGNARFGDLARPFRAVAGNLATLERVVFSSGDVATAIHASTAVPGICVPVTIDGETYIDGGVVDPLPVDVLREMGVHRIIAVDVIPTPERIRDGLKAERELAKHNGNGHHKLFRKVLPLDQQLNYFARGNLFEILMRSGQGAQIRVAEASCRLADLVLRPNIYDDRWADCSNPGKFIALGREVAERHLLEIQALVAGKTHKYEQKLPPEPLAAVA